MITVKEIEILFHDENYQESSLRIRESLQEDDTNGELFYYLFLSENGDYAHIDPDHIVNEIHLNKAIELANLRLKNEFEAEYNFYHAADSGIRKYFCYAARDNMESFSKHLKEYGLHPANLINDGTKEEDFLSNLDYVVTSRVSPEVIDLNLIALNILYFATRKESVLKICDMLKSRAMEIGTKLSAYPMDHYYDCIKAFEYLSLKEQPKKETPASEEVKIKEYKIPEVSELMKDEDDKKNITESSVESTTNENIPESNLTHDEKDNGMSYEEKIDKECSESINLSIIFLIISICIYLFSMCYFTSSYYVLNETMVAITYLGEFFTFVILILDFVRGLKGRKSKNAAVNNSLKILIFSFISLVFWIASFLVTTVYNFIV